MTSAPVQTNHCKKKNHNLWWHPNDIKAEDYVWTYLISGVTISSAKLSVDSCPSSGNNPGGSGRGDREWNKWINKLSMSLICNIGTNKAKFLWFYILTHIHLKSVINNTGTKFMKQTSLHSSFLQNTVLLAPQQTLQHSLALCAAWYFPAPAAGSD